MQAAQSAAHPSVASVREDSGDVAAYTGGGTGTASSSTPPRVANEAYNPFSEDVADTGDYRWPRKDL